MTGSCQTGIGRIPCFSHRSLVQVTSSKDGIGAATGLGIPAREYPVLSTELRKCWVWRDAEADIGLEIRFGSYRPLAVTMADFTMTLLVPSGRTRCRQ